MRNTVDTIIQPDYEGDHTESWDGKKHSDIFPAVYRRYRAPADEDECQKMISDLSKLITLINDQYTEVRSQAVSLGIDPARDLPTKNKLKTIRSARNRYEAVRRAYIHWLAVNSGADVVKSIGKTQYSTLDRINAIADGLKCLTGILISDLKNEESEQDLLSELELLRMQLEAIFVTPD